jgi:hypothetical protein
MRNPFFLMAIVSWFLLIHLAIIPVSAFLNGSMAQAAGPATVTLSASPPAGGSYNFGDEILFSGTNTDSNTTYLFFTGPGLAPAGSQIESSDPRISPVFDGLPFAFKAVRVGTDNHWSWGWDSHDVPLNTGTYTFYAVSTPRDKTHLAGAIYDSVAINITEPLLTAKVRPSYASEGETITISGMSTGHPGPGLAIWVIGPEYSGRSVVEPDLKGAYSLDIDSSIIHLLPGTYHVFVEHPSSDERFDFDLNGDYLFNNKIRSNIFTFQGNGRLYGEAAYTAFSAAINGPKTDDLIVPLSFSLGTPPATTAVTRDASPPVNATFFPGNGTTVSGNSTVPGDAAQPATIRSSLTPDTTGTVPEGPGNSSGNLSSPFGNTGDGMPYGIPVVIFGIVLMGGAGAAIFLFRKRRTDTVPENSPGDTILFRQRGRGQPGMADTGMPVPDTVLPSAMEAGTPAVPALTMNAFPRELAGKYTNISPIGSGGFAMVYSAYRISDNERVAVKIPIRSNERTGKSFLHEIRVWETMHHPNIVEVKTANILPVPYVEMEYVPGSLESMAKPVDIVTAARIIRGIAEGIRYAHARRCIHRDIKPQNILLTDRMVPKITDWGISKVLEENPKKTTIAGFSLAYAAPEQIEPDRFGSTDERTDIYQIGAVFYELVTGSTAFYGDSMMELVNETLEEDPIFPSDYNPDAAPVEQIILKCLAKYPALRYQSADELLDALVKFLSIHDRRAS